ncbi:hypothetical protein NC315_13510 [Streptomyces sp. G2]|uniref:hypothetical protein n=1 Tax=Streptomyces sp. G2 TaxID=1684471 RepID=UPI002030F94D|nr:hypothetical protein [Streptomyces sp. G2]MCM1946387.1 hypothetical protein [Streptomyces sp. G2]
MSMLAAPQAKWFARFEVEQVETVDETTVDEWDGDEWVGDETEEEEGEEEVVPVVSTDYREVVAWDGEGHAMVVDFSGGRLRRANEMEGFSGLATKFEWEAVGAGDDDEG